MFNVAHESDCVHLQVAIIYSNTRSASETAKEIGSQNNVHCAAYQADVIDSKGISDCFKKVVHDFGRLDIVVANAGVASQQAAEDYTPDQWTDVMKVNLDGAFYTAQAAANIFKSQGSGNIIFTGSVSATLVNVPQKQAAVRSAKSISS